MEGGWKVRSEGGGYGGKEWLETCREIYVIPAGCQHNILSFSQTFVAECNVLPLRSAGRWTVQLTPKIF